jgi:hypothetical protein
MYGQPDNSNQFSLRPFHVMAGGKSISGVLVFLLGWDPHTLIQLTAMI